MSREIKFRAWDKTYKRMNYKVQVGNTDYADQNYTCNSIWVDYGDRKSIGWINADEKCIDLMQFTGLHDKNGREVFEHDVDQFKRVVRFYRGNFVLESQNGNDWCYLSDCEDIEIIGNLHEHPELLTK